MILWGRPSSVNVQKVLWALDELGLSFENKVVGGPYGGLDDPAFAALTPMGKVPVLQDGDQAIWDSHAILRYLARREGALGDGTPAADMWMEFGVNTLQPPFIGIFWQRVRMTDAQRNADVDAAHHAATGAALDMLVRAFDDGRPFLAGADLSVADIAVGSLMYRIFDVAPDLKGCGAVDEWVARLQDRPAYRNRIETSYEELRVT